MATRIPGKSILKHQTQATSTPTTLDSQKAQTERDQRNLNTALHHAHKFQNQKDVSAQVLNSIVILLEMPATTTFTPKETLAFIDLVQIFQPSDFDSLVEERRIDGKCGYALCSNVPRSLTQGKSATWKLKDGAGDWCSNDCAKKALYVKSQLNEVPAWEREAEQQPEVLLHESDRLPGRVDEARRARRAARANQRRQVVANEEELARERGEKPSSFRPKQVMKDVIVEKPSTIYVEPKSIDNASKLYLKIEGYEPKIKLNNKPEHLRKADSDDDSSSDG